MCEITIDLLADWCEMLKAELARRGYVLHESAAPEDISLAFYNLQRRLVPPRQRAVFMSRELGCPYEHRVGLDLLLRKASEGSDLRPYQSKKLLNAAFNDSLLSHWRIHHFHLGTRPDPKAPEFVERSRFVLFAWATNDELFAIDVMGHGNWSRQRLLKIVDDNWPALIENYRLKQVVGLKRTISDYDVQCLRSISMNSATEVNGQIYAPPGGGCAASGTSVAVVFQHDSACEIFESIQNRVVQNIHNLVEHARRAGYAMTPPFHFKLNPVAVDRIEVIELHSKARFVFPAKI